jgi:hypothetical protein
MPSDETGKVFMGKLGGVVPGLPRIIDILPPAKVIKFLILFLSA